MAAMSQLKDYKLTFVGDQSVGKSSIIARFSFDKFNSTYEATIGFNSLLKTMPVGNRTARLQIWDTSGQEKNWILMLSYIRESSVAVIVYDVADRKSFLNISKWMEQVRTAQRAGGATIVALVGNKTDLLHGRQVSREEGDRKARELGAMFVETSAKSDIHVQHLFNNLAAAAVARGDLAGMRALSSTKEEKLFQKLAAAVPGGDLAGVKALSSTKEEKPMPPKKDVSRIFEIQQELWKAKQLENQNFDSHLVYLKKLWNELRQLRLNPQSAADREEEDQIFQLLGSLPPEYDDIRRQVLTCNPLRTLTEVCIAIRVAEKRRNMVPKHKSSLRCDNCGGDDHTVDCCWELLHPTVTETEQKPEHVIGFENRIETSAFHGLDSSHFKPSTNSGPMINKNELQNQEENCHGKSGEWVLCSSTPEL